MTLEAALGALTEATEKNTAILERLLAGQEVALAKIEAGAGSPTTTRRTRKPETEPAPAVAAEPATVHPLLAEPNGETAKNAKGVDEATKNFRAADFSLGQVKSEFVGWLGSTPDPTERKAFVTALADHFGVKQLFHATEGLKDEEARKQTLFYLRRKREGLKVDFSADYDFDGDPLADQTVDGEEETDALG